MSYWRLAFVVPRYGKAILGGAETFVRELATHVANAGIAEVEVFTTCASDHLTWHNDLPAGTTHEAAVTVHRYPIDRRDRNHISYNSLSAQIAQFQVLSPQQQLEWATHSAHAPSLYATLSRRAHQFDLIFFAPYLAGTTLFGTALAPEKSVLWPCLHNESFAYLDIVREMFGACKGIMYNTLPEQTLAEQLYWQQHPGAATIGIGFDPPASASPQRFRQKYGLTTPFILYSGRLEPAKNVELLLKHFLRYSASHQQQPPLKLVLMGSGPVPVPKHPHIVAVGYQPDQEKADAFAAASVLCQPSTNESFSIVLMESWQQAVPVLVNQYCDVTRHHVLSSNGGLTFASYEEFEETLNLLAAEESLRQQLGRNGQTYVKQNFNWDSTLLRFKTALQHWTKRDEIPAM